MALIGTLFTQIFMRLCRSFSGDKYVWIFEDMAAKFETQWGENVTFEEYSKAKEKWYAENS